MGGLVKNLGAILFAALSIGCGTTACAGPLAINLGTAASFAVLAGSTVTNTGSSVITGNLGVWPGMSATGFPPGMILDGNAYINDAFAMEAQSDALTAFNTAAGETGGQSLTGQNLGGLTLTPGVYSFSSSADLTGALTLNAENTQNAVFVFQIGSTLTTAAGSLISFINGQSDDVIWEVGSSATLGAGSSFEGDILALTSITLDSGAAISCGGVIALTGAVTMDSNTVSNDGAACGAGSAPIPEPAPIFVLSAACSMLAVLRMRPQRPSFP
jgi:type VI secretion system secreted protein VgrG